MKRYEFEIRSALVDSIERVNKTMNDFGYPGHALGYRIGSMSVNIPETETVDSMRMKLEQATNEVMKKELNKEIWLVNVGYVNEEKT